MKRQNYHSCITANVTIKRAFEGICNVAGWWATNITGTTGKLNDSFTVRFGKTFADIKITKLVPDKKITWRITGCYLPLFKDERQWENTEIVWEISKTNNTTEISMTHVGLTPEKECYADCEKGWNFYVKESLFKLLTENKGIPGTGIFANIFIEGRKHEGLLYFKNDPLPDYPDGYIFIDIKETNGEQVISAFNADIYNKETFKVQHIKGEYFMLLENKCKPGHNPVLEDIINTIKQQK